MRSLVSLAKARLRLVPTLQSSSLLTQRRAVATGASNRQVPVISPLFAFRPRNYSLGCLISSAGIMPSHGEDVKAQKRPLSTGDKTSGTEEDPQLLKFYNSEGEPVFITKQNFIEQVLPYNLQEAWENPDELYQLIQGMFDDNIFMEVQAAAEQLYAIDPIPGRGATMLAICYMHTDQLDKAEVVLNAYINEHGEDEIILTNLAKVYSYREEHDKAEEILFHSLELDPNQQNGLEWYMAIHTRKDGSFTKSLERIASMPQSWRAQLYLAESALEEEGDLTKAMKLYREALERSPDPVEAMALQKISAGLGQRGHWNEAIEIVEHLFQVEVHGMTVGNNLIKCHLDLGNRDRASALVEQLKALKRPDWEEVLHYWEDAIAKEKVTPEK
mmetsp:Transcript_11154/g.17919  ORF Transcript_11154/g.17919 Transcript_11154/m.17919 type:complete len:387 (-) Transcript_11154:11-1171(-)